MENPWEFLISQVKKTITLKTKALEHSCVLRGTEQQQTGKDQVPPAGTGQVPGCSVPHGNVTPFSFYMPKINELIFEK